MSRNDQATDRHDILPGNAPFERTSCRGIFPPPADIKSSGRQYVWRHATGDDLSGYFRGSQQTLKLNRGRGLQVRPPMNLAQQEPGGQT